MLQSEVVGLVLMMMLVRPMTAQTNNLALTKAEDVTGELKAKHSQSLTFDVQMSNSELHSGNHNAP